MNLGPETCPTSDVTYVEAPTRSPVATTTFAPERTSTPNNIANCLNHDYESTSTFAGSSPLVIPIKYAAHSTPKKKCYDCNGLRKKCYLLRRKNKRLTNRLQCFKDKVQQLQTVLVWMVTQLLDLNLPVYSVQNKFETYCTVASLKSKYYKCNWFSTISVINW